MCSLNLGNFFAIHHCSPTNLSFLLSFLNPPLLTYFSIMTTVPPPLKTTIINWPCLQSQPNSPSKSSPQPDNTQTKQQKTFAQAVSNICDIPLSQLPKPCLKGEDRAIQIPDNEYEAGLETCKHNLQGRIIWPKGSNPITVDNLINKLSVLWKTIGRWRGYLYWERIL